METLPAEIITQIMEYLPFDDRREVAMVNETFYYGSYHPMFSRKELLTYRPLNKNLNSFNEFKNMLKKSRRILFCLKFEDLNLIDDLTIFTDLGNRIVLLNFYNLQSLDDSFLDAIAQCCINLEKLVFVRLTSLFLTDKDRAPILKLCCIDLDDVQITDREFNVILKLAPNLKDLSIIDSNINTSSLVFQRFYPHDTNGVTNNDHLFNKYNSNYIFSDKNIIHHLNNSVRLNSLVLSECHIFFQIQPLRHTFKSLMFSFEKTFTNQPFNFMHFEVLNQYVSLERLEIHNLPVELLSNVSKLYNLRHLILSYITVKSNVFNGPEIFKSLKSFLLSLKDFKYIKTLSFNRANENHGIMFPTLALPNCIFDSLTSLDCSLDTEFGVLIFGKNLTSLRIRNGEILDEYYLKLLFSKLTNLMHLHIDQCCNVNDSILIDLPISNLKGLITLKIMESKVSYRCLQSITNSSLKVLIFTDVSFESISSEHDLNKFEESISILSTNIPTLTHLEVCMTTTSLRLIESLKLLSYFRNAKTLINMNFKRMKMFKLWDWYSY
uniref:F-box domain-containing protein n=1 Tax=Schizaphis graminum TaxID=13262 RepID=A0A2S2P810_SCHGA